MMDHNMEMWQEMFQELIQEVKPWHTWTLKLDRNLIPNSLRPGWIQYQQWVFARFQCSLCSRSWASAQVHILFHMHWGKGESKGQVKMRIFAQRCRKCSQPPFEIPEFTEENISRILKNLVFQILKKCYREGFKSMKETPKVRGIHLEGPHDVDNYEACLHGFCAQSGLGLTTQPLKSLALPIISLPNSETPINKPSPTKSSITKGKVMRDTRVEKGKVPPNLWFPERTRAASLRANTNYCVETRIRVPHTSENFSSFKAQNPKHRKLAFGALLILILVIVMVVVIVKTYV